jgi:hypothetical protein
MMKIIRYFVPIAEPELHQVEAIDEFQFVDAPVPKKPEEVTVRFHCEGYHLVKDTYHVLNNVTIGHLLKKVAVENKIPRLIAYVKVGEKIKPLLSASSIAQIEKMLGYELLDAINIYLTKSF